MESLSSSLSKGTKNIVKDIKSQSNFLDEEILSLPEYKEDVQVLDTLGIDYEIKESEELNYKLTSLEIAKKKYSRPVILGQTLKEYCVKYNLKALPISKFAGKLHPDLASEIKKFTDENDLIIRQNSFYVIAPSEQFHSNKSNRNLHKKFKTASNNIILYMEGSNESSHGDIRYIDEEDILVNVFEWGKEYNFLRTLSYLKQGRPFNSNKIPISSCLILMAVILAATVALNSLITVEGVNLVISIGFLGLYIALTTGIATRIKEYTSKWNRDNYYY